MDHLDGAAWRKSSYSGSNGGNCIEIATGAPWPSATAKTRTAPMLVFGAGAWQQFAEQVKTT